MRMRPLVLCGLMICSCSSGAQELSLLAGAMQDSASRESSYAWALDYRHGLGEHLTYTLSWLNEGHVTNHHRDGQSAQLWARTNLLERRLSLSAGVGPYRYYDTTRRSPNDGFSDQHGWGSIFSLAATYYTPSGWLYEARANRVVANNSIDTTSLLLGIGYQLERPPTPGPYANAPRQTTNTTNNEVAIFLGQTVVNSFQSEHDTARAVEYRHGVSPHIDWTVSWLNEGDARLIRRNGLIAQVWAVHEFFDERLTLGAGLGPYFSIDRYRMPLPGEASDVSVSAIVTATASVRLSSRAFLRGSWNRIASTYNRDSDVILGGLGYRF